MTVTAPPRPPRPSDPVTHGEFDALVEALIEEARQRTRRRRRRNGAIVTLVALVGVALFAMLGRSAQSQTASPAISARSSFAAQAASSKIAFISEGPPGSGGYCGVVYVMNADGSGQRRLSPGPADECRGEFTPAWSPDGRKIAIGGNLDGKNGIYVMNTDGRGQKRLTGGVGSDSGLAWSPDGQTLAFTRFAPRGFSELYVVSADGSGERRLTKRARAGQLSWSPRGDKLAFVGRSDRRLRGESNMEIYVINPDGSGQQRLTRNTVLDSDPAWSPDGRRIAFVSNWQLYVVNSDGSGQRRLTRTSGAHNVAPAWSPDGQRIVFERRVGRQKYRNTALEYGQCSRCDGRVRFQVWVMNPDGSEAGLLARDAAQPVWSPGGLTIAYEYPIGPRGPGGLGKQTDIYVMNADGSEKRNLTRSSRQESQPVWSPAQR